MYLEFISDLNNLDIVIKYKAFIENLSSLERLFISLIFFCSVYLLSKIADRFRSKKVIALKEEAETSELNHSNLTNGLYQAKNGIKKGLYLDTSVKRIQKRKYRLNNEDFKIKYIKYNCKNIAYPPKNTEYRLQNKFYKS